MGLDSPQTYAEWYWKNGLDKDLARSEDYEKVLAPVAEQFINAIPAYDKLPKHLQDLLRHFSAPEAPGFDNALMRFVGNIGSGLANRVLGHEVREFDYHMNQYLQNLVMTPEVANLLKFRQKITDDLWLDRLQFAGMSEAEANIAYEATKPYPTIPELITYARYHDVPDNPKEFLWKIADVSPADWQMWNWLSFQKLNTDQVLSLFRRRFWTEDRCLTELARLGWPSEERTALNDLAYVLPNAMLLLQGELFQGVTTETILNDLSKADIHPAFAQTYMDGVLTKPNTMDIIAYELRRDPSLNQLGKELRRIGIHPEYNDVYETLAHPIPPIQDIISMAVREAFTPAIAQRFGQYEDLPPEFIEWAEKKGLTREWAERYWAAHWSLPSTMQGFEMLHRGIISREDLELLLRASDVMPFWRNRLIEMAYKPLTRVDVRRMFGLGVIDEQGIDKAYRDLGYNEENARRMSEFTIRQTRQSLSGFRANDVVQAYSKRFIDRSQAQNLLRDIVSNDKEIGNILATADHKRDWYNKQERMDAIANLFKKGRYTMPQTRNALSALGFAGDYVDTLIEQWELKTEAEKESTWTSAQTLGFLKKGLINTERARAEFILLGYNAERINVYLASAKPPD